MDQDDKILVVEDNTAIAECIEERYNCDRATDGWDAIEKLEEHDYAAIIIDADVPNQSGYGVITYLREEVGENLGNVIFMTTADCEEVRRRIGETLRVISKGKQEAVDEIARVLHR